MIQQVPNDATAMEEVVKNIIKKDDANDVIQFEIKSIEPIAEHREYNGLRVKLLVLIK